jgi:hypothetical protein
MRAVIGTAAAICVVVVAVVIGILVVQLARGDSVDVTDLAVGECFSLDASVADDGSIDLVDTLDCAEPHDAQVVAVGELNPGGERAYPLDEELFAEVDARCSAVEPDERFGVVPIAPTRATWDGRNGRYACVALVVGGGTVTGDHAAIAGAVDGE